ncbi:barstar family protein [Kribbella sp. NPDC051587]|uniref:barstar family protein n=1 Tax=Kribbella sp. NPDC051587 TaxID=3364119 RepID=UPI0037B2B43F
MKDLSLLVADKDTANDLLWDWEAAGWAARGMRGKKMRTADRLWDEFAAACQFPWYCGKNWDAFRECLGDMDTWLTQTSGIALLMYDAAEVLLDESAEQIEILLRSFGSAAEGYAVAMGRGAVPAVPFHIVLQAEAGRPEAVVRERWTAAGADLVPFTRLDG